MSEAQQGPTQGPWYVEHAENEDGDYVPVAIQTAIDRQGFSKIVAGVDTEGVIGCGLILHDDTVKLLLAAPQLLAACEAVLNWYERDGSVGGAVDPMETLAAAIKAAREG